MDKGHLKLTEDLNNLLCEAKQFEFHDFKNEKYAMPKKTLVDKLETIITNTKQGDYDN